MRFWLILVLVFGLLRVPTWAQSSCWSIGDEVDLYVTADNGGNDRVMCFVSDNTEIYVSGGAAGDSLELGNVIVDGDAQIELDGLAARLVITGHFVSNRPANVLPYNVPPIYQGNPFVLRQSAADPAKGFVEFYRKDTVHKQCIQAFPGSGAAEEVTFPNLELTGFDSVNNTTDYRIELEEIDAKIERWGGRILLNNRQFNVRDWNLELLNPDPLQAISHTYHPDRNAAENNWTIRSADTTDVDQFGFVGTETCGQGRLVWFTDDVIAGGQFYNFPVGTYDYLGDINARLPVEGNPMREVQIQAAPGSPRQYEVMVVPGNVVNQGPNFPCNSPSFLSNGIICELNGPSPNQTGYAHVINDARGETPVEELRVYHNHDYPINAQVNWTALAHWEASPFIPDFQWENTFAEMEREPPFGPYARLRNYSNFSTELFAFGIEAAYDLIKEPPFIPKNMNGTPPHVTLEVGDSATFQANGEDGGRYCYEWRLLDLYTGEERIIAGPEPNLIEHTETFDTAGRFELIMITHPCGFRNKINCLEEDRRSILVEPPQVLTIPNAFTPGGGGNPNINENFVLWAKNVAKVRCKIYNRWGNVVAEKIQEGLAEGGGEYVYTAGTTMPALFLWNGGVDNNIDDQVPEGVYTYKLDVLFENGKMDTRAGTVTVVR